VSNDDVISSTTNDNEPPPLLQSIDDICGSLGGGTGGNILPVNPVGEGLRVMACTSHDQHTGQLGTGYDLASEDKASQ
jgi:hypothetical protein